MAETPFDSLQKRERERRLRISSKIESKDLKQRSTSYNLKIESDNPEANPPILKDKNRHSFTHSAKKSSYCRKFLNRTIEGHVTTEEFTRFREKISRGSQRADGRNDLFRQFWQRGSERGTEELRVLEVSGRGREEKPNISLPQQPVLVFHRSMEDRRPEKIEDITEIAEQRRKQSLDFDLQVQGNKKTIRVKDGSKVGEKKGRGLEGDISGEWSAGEMRNQNGDWNTAPQKVEQLKPPCTFFKRFKERHFPLSEGLEVEATLESKIRYNLDRLQAIGDPQWAFSRSNTGDLPSVNSPFRLRRQIRSSWKKTSLEQDRGAKVSTAEPVRLPFRRNRVVVPKPTFTNDIIGWNVRPENDEDEGILFGQ